MEGLLVTCPLAPVASALQAAPAPDAPTLRQSQTVLRTVCVRAQPHIRFLFIVPRFRLGLAYRTPPRDDALSPLANLRLCEYLVSGLSPDWIRAMHGTHVEAKRRLACEPSALGDLLYVLFVL